MTTAMAQLADTRTGGFEGADPSSADRLPTGFTFFVPGDCVPWARAGGGKSVVRFTPPKQRNYAAALKQLCLDAMLNAGQGKPLDGPLSLALTAAYPWPKTMSAKKRTHPSSRWRVSKPDFDNLAKIVGDALNKIAWLDDAQIAQALVTKVYSDRPGLLVRVEVLA